MRKRKPRKQPQPYVEPFKRRKSMRAWSAFPDPHMGIYRNEKREISQRGMGATS